MDPLFRHTFRSMSDDGGLRAGPIGLLAVMGMGAGLIWSLTAQVDVRAVSQRAELRVEADGRPLVPQVAGVVEAILVPVGESVDAGQVVLRLDSQAITRQLQAVRAEVEALTVEIEAVEDRLAHAEAAARTASAVGDEARAVAEANAGGAAARDALAQAEADRIAALREAGAVTTWDVQQADTRRASAQAEAVAASRRSRQEDLEATLTRFEYRAGIDAQRAERAMAERRLAAVRAREAALAQRLAWHEVRAPADGVVGSLADLTPGAWVAEATQVGTIIPEGDLRLVAWFDSDRTLGHLAVGQTAELRLSAFPWTEWGALPAEVVGVALVAQEQEVRVELALTEVESATMPLQHGLRGTTVVSLEEARPVDLLLRTLGHRLDRMGP